MKQVLSARVFFILIIGVFVVAGALFFSYSQEKFPLVPEDDMAPKKEKSVLEESPLLEKSLPLEKSPASIQQKAPLEVKWEKLPSPPGGGYWTISIAPSAPRTIYVGSRDFNVLKSKDGGESWEILGEKLFGAHILSNTAIHPKNNNKALVSNGQIHLTEDGGKNWNGIQEEDGIDNKSMSIISITFDPTNPKRVYAGEEAGNIFASENEGLSWKQIASLKKPVKTLVVDHKNSNVLYALVSDSGVFKSVDRGNTWEEKITDFSSENRQSLVMNPSNSNILYLAGTDGVLRTLDAGNTWRNLTPGIGGIISIALSSDGKAIFITTESKKVYKSINAGDTWQDVFTASNIQMHSGATFAVAVDPVNSLIVYVTTNQGIFKSVNGGDSWKQVDNEVYDDAAFVLGYAKDTKTLWVGNFWTRGIFTTKDDGKTWRFLRSWREDDPADHYPMNIVVDPRDGNRVFVSGAAGIKRTEDNGTTWKALGEGLYLFEKHVHGLSLDPTNPDILYAGTAPGWDQINSVAKVYKTSDGGTIWRELKKGFPQNAGENNVYAFAVAKSNSSIVYMAINGHESDQEPHPDPLGVWKSVNGGETWAEINSNLPQKNVFSLAVHPENPEVIYAGLGHIEEGKGHGEQGLYKSMDGGKSWQRVGGLPHLQPSRIRFFPKNPNMIFVSFGEHICGACGSGYPRGVGMYGSTDGGNTWHQLAKGFSSREQAIMDFVFTDENVIYAGTDDGIFKGSINLK